jgi:hypothetical protein
MSQASMEPVRSCLGYARRRDVHVSGALIWWLVIDVVKPSLPALPRTWRRNRPAKKYLVRGQRTKVKRDSIIPISALIADLKSFIGLCHTMA